MKRRWAGVSAKARDESRDNVLRRGHALVAEVQCVGQLTQKQRQRSNQVQHKMLLMADLPVVAG